MKSFVNSIINLDERKLLTILVLISIVLRSLYVFFIYNSSGTNHFMDDLYYIYLGESIAAGNINPQIDGIVEFASGPVIPFLVAFFILLFSDPIIPFFAYNILVSAIMVPVLYYMGKNLFNKQTAIILALWGVGFMEATKYAPHVLKEPTVFFVFPLTLLLLFLSSRSTSHFKYLLFSVLSFAILIHTDERFFIYFPFFALFFFLDKTVNKKVVFQRVGLWIILGVLLMLPWTIRNYNVFDQLVILSPRTTTITSKLWGEDLGRGASHFTNPDMQQAMIEARRDRATEFGEKFGKTPYEYGKWEARLKAFQHFWQPTYVNLHFIQYGFRTVKWSFRHNAVSMIFYGIFLPFYIIGFYFLVKRKHWTGLFIALIPFIHSLMHAYMVWSLERYRSPITFIVVMIGIWAALEIYEWFRKRFLQKQKTV